MAKRRHGPVSVQKAIEIYYKNAELGPDEIKELFGCSNAVACKYRIMVREYVAKNCDFELDGLLVPTEEAYAAWGIDIASYERRFAKLQKYNFV